MLAVYDGTNTTIKRREFLNQSLQKENFDVLWVECFSKNHELIDLYIKKSKVFNDDYKNKNISPEDAFLDFKERIKTYQQQYEPVSEAEKERINKDPKQSYLYMAEFGDHFDFTLYKEDSQFLK